MKKIVVLTGILCAYSIAVFSQGNEIDAYTLSKTELSGTARSMAMGGAFGALGGDLSVVSINPAGLGIYRSSEVSGTFGLSVINNSTNWYGMSKNVGKLDFSPDNLGFELYLPTSSENVLNWNVAFSYNRLKNFNREYKMENQSNMRNSIGDYVASRANGIREGDLALAGNYDPYENSALGGNWLSILGYESYMINPVKGQDGSYSGFFDNYRPAEGRLRVTENGHIDEMNFGLGTNISNFLFLGASVSATDLSYRLNSAYVEYNGLNDCIFLDNWLTTEGKAYSFNFGAIMNLQFFRLGVAYSTSKWYEMTDYYNATATTKLNEEREYFVRSTPDDQYSEYKFKTPDKWTFSAALILGRFALLSADYELTNYKNMKYLYTDGGEMNVNKDIAEDFDYSRTLKLGGEVKITQQFAVRAGYAMQPSPMQTRIVNNEVEVLPSGTIPHFTTTAASTDYFTAGLGYRFTPNFYMDFAGIYKTNKGKAYAFSNRNDVSSEAASLTDSSFRLVMTMGYKF